MPRGHARSVQIANKEPERGPFAADAADTHVARSDLFYRELALHVAKAATAEFERRTGVQAEDGADAVQAFLRTEIADGRLKRKEIVAKGTGFRLSADVSSCPFQATCQSNHRALGEVPQCMRAIILIQAIGAKVPNRPPMTYDLDPGLVDGTSDACHIQLRPAGVPPEPSQRK